MALCFLAQGHCYGGTSLGLMVSVMGHFNATEYKDMLCVCMRYFKK